MFTDFDVDHWNRVAVLGPVTATNLFGFSDPLGQTIKINGINFPVIGVLKSKGDQGWFNPDDQVIVPYTVDMHVLMGVDYLREIDVQCRARLRSGRRSGATSIRVMRQRHKIQPDAPDDVLIQNQAAVRRGFQPTPPPCSPFLLGTVGGISLLVGGIGIMNIMLVTVTERTREIGIRKAIGAREFDILSQFLIEAMLMSGVGGITGMGLGVGVAKLVGDYTPFATMVRIYSASSWRSSSPAVVGVFFGFYPAIRASKLDPIEALRYE